MTDPTPVLDIVERLRILHKSGVVSNETLCTIFNESADEIERLRTSAVRGEVVENGSSPAVWQPIETAPKDGTEVDLWVVGDKELGPLRISDAQWKLGGWQMYSDKWGYMPVEAHACSATHWRSPPAPPEAEGADSRTTGPSNERPEGRSNLKGASPDARNKALEEAAAVADTFIKFKREFPASQSVHLLTATDIAHAIRALKSPEPTTKEAT